MGWRRARATGAGAGVVPGGDVGAADVARPVVGALHAVSVIAWGVSARFVRVCLRCGARPSACRCLDHTGRSSHAVPVSALRSPGGRPRDDRDLRQHVRVGDRGVGGASGHGATPRGGDPRAAARTRPSGRTDRLAAALAGAGPGGGDRQDGGAAGDAGRHAADLNHVAWVGHLRVSPRRRLATWSDLLAALAFGTALGLLAWTVVRVLLR